MSLGMIENLICRRRGYTTQYEKQFVIIKIDNNNFYI